MSKEVEKKQNKPAVWIWILGAAVIFLILAGVIALPRLQQGQAGLPMEVTVEQAHQLREDGAFVLDVRQPDEWAATHIPGATLIPLDQLETRLSEVPKDQQVLVYCRSGNRSKEGRDILLKAGFDQVTSMAGGIKEWTAAEYPTESGQ
jgi:rhodanese-related sulfurtransferase